MTALVPYDYKKDIARAMEVGKSLNIKPVNLVRGSYSANTFSTGLLSLDLILGGGYGIGRWVSIYGPSGAGKSTLVYTAMAMLQRLHCPQIVFDHEGSLDPMYCHSIGVSMLPSAGFICFPADVGEHTFRYIRRYLKQLPDLSDEERMSLVVPRAVFFIDSLAAMVPEALDEKDDDATIAMQGRMFSKFIPLVRSLLMLKGCTVIATNQLRSKPMSFGNPEVEPGGNAVQFYPDMRLRMSSFAPPLKKDKDGKQEKPESGSYSYKEEPSIFYGGGTDRFTYSRIVTKKNKQFTPYLTVEMRINLGRGFDAIMDGHEYLDMTGQLTGSGGNYTIHLRGEEPIKVHGWGKMARIVAHPLFRAKCRAQIRSNIAFEMFFEVNRGREKGEESRGEDPVAVYSLSAEGEGETEGEVKLPDDAAYLPPQKHQSTGAQIKAERQKNPKPKKET